RPRWAAGKKAVRLEAVSIRIGAAADPERWSLRSTGNGRPTVADSRALKPARADPSWAKALLGRFPESWPVCLSRRPQRDQYILGDFWPGRISGSECPRPHRHRKHFHPSAPRTFVLPKDCVTSGTSGALPSSARGQELLSAGWLVEACRPMLLLAF